MDKYVIEGTPKTPSISFDLNGGVLDKSFTVNWNDYKNCILLIQTDGFNRIDTKVKTIINL